VNLLEKPEIRSRWQFKWVHCDEGQDTDNLQFRMLQLVSQRDGNVFVVGDANQSMYGFRGAKPDNLLKFESWFPGAQTLILPENFRSTPEIVEFSQMVAPIKNELTANMRTANPNGVKIEIVNYLGNEDEAENVLDRIADMTGKSAILARTNQQIGLIETVCTLNDVKFHLLGKSGFWRTSEIKNVIGLVGFVLSNKAAETYPQRLVAPVRHVAMQLRAVDAVRNIIEHAKLRDLYDDDDYEDNDNFALANLNGVINIAQRFATLKEFYDFANRASHASRKSKHAITLGTIHSAKGLEWDNVFVIGAQDGRIPHEKATDLHEERCIFYVAVSRPSKVLQVSYSGQRSRFLDEIEAEEELA
jgi:DNA helicase-2/ATP-dependent DNA helicase PcrA